MPLSEAGYRKWAGQRVCILCGARPMAHKYKVVPGPTTPRPVLVRIIDGTPHYYDPGDRRYNGR